MKSNIIYSIVKERSNGLPSRDKTKADVEDVTSFHKTVVDGIMEDHG